MNNHILVPTPEEVTELGNVSERMTFHGKIRDDVIPVTDLGGGLRFLSEKKVDFTIARAEALLQLPEFIVEDAHVDRGLRDPHVAYLVNCMRRGTFHPEWVTIITCVCLDQVGEHPPGTIFRMNGQHTATGRKFMPPDWPCLVKMMHYEATLTNDMRMLYASIDRNAYRTRGNVVNSYLAGTDQFLGISNRIITVISGALPFWLWENQETRKAHDADEVAYLLQTEHFAVTNHVVGYMQGCIRGNLFERCIRRTPVVAALFETFSKHPTKSPLFWDVVGNGIGGGEGNIVTGPYDPRIRLHNALRESVITQAGHIGHSQARHGKKTVPVEIMYRWCIQCWNAWRRGEEVRNIKAANERHKAR